MDPETDEKVMDGVKSANGSMKQNSTVTMDQDRSKSIEENLEKLAALNLSSDMSMQPRFSTTMIRLVSAAAGILVLLLIYLVVKFLY